MSELSEHLRYTKDHEWARRNDDGTITVGITAHAVDQLGDITAVSLPEVGEALEAGERFGDIDSVKAVSDLYAPITGEVVEINAKLDDEPELINDAPYEGGWMIRIRPGDGVDLGDLLDAAAYQQVLDDL
ncbi:Glycine cleavage system H protein [Enhygromyxa salina]|uniref:Glycine cleavage system H protein n=1 Tax=Enhygromyxa salina TaxID=215803 RepID=A0A2S9YF64_9BACT|nr:glycine cleavage system protein GcvH [Enhygromyxa salina]PRQ03757.1 Glycine cleavage system H protein [Enhygromyxa salina]